MVRILLGILAVLSFLAGQFYLLAKILGWGDFLDKFDRR